ncbi:hypothetical protein [Sulfitobacter sp. R86518]|uniref:hypothetical protein n=1 Tax=Sulfitobacter sp. R86518 TaxID=3093858 RepID=UPI0036DF7EF9
MTLVGVRHSPFADLEQTYAFAAAKEKYEPEVTDAALCTNDRFAVKSNANRVSPKRST